MVFPTFFNLSLNLAIRSSWSEPQSVPGLVFADCIELLHFWLQKYNQSDFGIVHLVMSMFRVVSCVIPKNFSYCKESSRTDNKFPNLWRQQRDSEPPGYLTLEASGIWLQNLHRNGETDSLRAQTKPCEHQEPGEKRSDPTKDWLRLACECPGVFRGGVGQQWPAAGLGVVSVTVHAQDLLKELTIIFITSTIVWSQVK